MTDFGLDFSMTTWGSPDAPKRALLLHGLQGVGQVFFKVAKVLVANGQYCFSEDHMHMEHEELMAQAMYVTRTYFSANSRHKMIKGHRLIQQRVDAPDLLGHGWAPRSTSLPSASDSTPTAEAGRYTIPLISSHLAQHLSSTKYDVIAGVSFGSTALLPLLTSFKHPPARAVLVEPILDMPPVGPERVAAMVKGVETPPSEEEVAKMNPTWSREECALRRMGVLQLDKRVVGDLFDEVNLGHLSHALIPPLSAIPDTELIILAGDPAIRSVYPASHADLLRKEYPHVKFGQRFGASHDMHKDKPEVVAGVIMHGLDGGEGVEVLV